KGERRRIRARIARPPDEVDVAELDRVDRRPAGEVGERPPALPLEQGPLDEDGAHYRAGARAAPPRPSTCNPGSAPRTARSAPPTSRRTMFAPWTIAAAL